jgi:hypothetical protein
VRWGVDVLRSGRWRMSLAFFGGDGDGESLVLSSGAFRFEDTAAEVDLTLFEREGVTAVATSTF